MRRHAWNCDLSTKPGTDILTNRHIYIHRIFGILLGYQGFIWEYGDLTSNILRYDLMIFNGDMSEYNGILDVMECTVMWLSLE